MTPATAPPLSELLPALEGGSKVDVALVVELRASTELAAMAVDEYCDDAADDAEGEDDEPSSSKPEDAAEEDGKGE